MPWADGYTPEMAREFVDRNAARPGNPPVPEASYVVCDRSGGLPGGCGLHARLGPNALEIGYWVDVRHTRRGVATLATGALTELAMGIAEVEVVEIHHDQANRRSGAVPARRGYELVTTVNDEPEAPGEVGIELQWRMTRAAWPTSAGAQLLAEARTAAPPSRRAPNHATGTPADRSSVHQARRASAVCDGHHEPVTGQPAGRGRRTATGRAREKRRN
ncbi:MAG: GNAT family N-acetyltransferase [Mycobacteriales bacterium]